MCTCMLIYFCCRGETMHKMRNSVAALLEIHLKQMLRTPWTYWILGCMAIVGVTMAIPYNEILSDTKNNIAIGELELIVSYRIIRYGALIYCLLVSKTKINIDDHELIISRTGRLHYILSEEVFIIILAFVFLQTPRIATLITCFNNIAFANAWSDAGLVLAELEKAPAYSPASIALCSIGMQWIYCIILGNFIALGDLLFKEKYGFTVSAYVHGLFWVMYLDGIWGKISILSNAYVSYKLRDNIERILVNLAVVVLLFLLIVIRARKIEIRGRNND